MTYPKSGDKKYDASVQRAKDRADREITKRAALYRSLTDAEIRAKLHGKGTSPWERAACRRVLRERGVSDNG